MERSEILEQLRGIFTETLDNEDIILSEQTTATDIEEWDSLTHVELVVAIEARFHITFTAMEIQGWKNVGEMIDSIGKKN